MRKSAALITAGILAGTPMASVLSLEFINEEAAEAYLAMQEEMRQEIQETLRKGITDDTALRDAIRRVRHLGSSPEELTGNMRRLVEATGIPHERVINALEDMILRTLSAIEEDESKIASVGISGVMPLLEAFPDHDILPIVKECLKSKSSHIRRTALESYASVKGAKSLPLLRDALAKKSLTDNDSDFLYRHLSRISIDLKMENKTNDVEKINAFLKEMKQAEQAKEKGEN